MTDPREMLARLNPTNVRFDVGRGGGVPELTNIDIAGALGMVPAGLGRDLMELLHGPDPSKQDICRVFERVCKLAMDESFRRVGAHCEAKTLWGLSESLAGFHRNKTQETKQHLTDLKAKMHEAREKLWPERLHEVLPVMAGLLIGFMRGERLSARERARRLGMDESTYRERWSDVYEWLLSKMLDAEQEAARDLGRALRRDVA